MKARLLVSGIEKHRLCALLGMEDGGGVEFEALRDLVLELDLGAERIGGGPGLREGEAVSLVGVLALYVASDEGIFRVAVSVDLESDVGGCGGLDLEGSAMEVVVLAEEIVGGLSKVLYT